MDVKKLAGSGLILALLLSGCGEKSSSGTSQPANQPAATGQAQASPAPYGQANRQNNTQFEMVMAFNTLMQMDKADGLTITKDQAATMLPIVEKAAADGQWSTELTAKLQQPLNEKQTAFIKENAMAFGGGRNGQGGGQGQGGRGQGGQGQGQQPGAGSTTAPDGNQVPGSQPSGSGGKPPAGQMNGNGGQAPTGQIKPNASGAPNAQGGGRMNGGGGGMNANTVTEQFIALLKTK